MSKTLTYIILVVFICLLIGNFYIFNFSAEGLERAGQFGNCLSEKTKIDCGFDAVEHFKSPTLTAGLASMMGFLNLIFLVSVLVFILWFKRKPYIQSKLK